MKFNLKVVSALVLGVALGTLVRIPIEQPVHAAESAASEQYKVVSLMRYEGREEEILNKLAADGWKVRTAAMAAVIMAK